MAIKFESVQAGEVLWDVRRTRMGHTTMSTMGSWEVKVVSIDHAAGYAIVIWNHNTGNPKRYSRRQIERLRRTPYKKRAPQ